MRKTEFAGNEIGGGPLFSSRDIDVEVVDFLLVCECPFIGLVFDVIDGKTAVQSILQIHWQCHHLLLDLPNFG